MGHVIWWKFFVMNESYMVNLYLSRNIFFLSTIHQQWFVLFDSLGCLCSENLISGRRPQRRLYPVCIPAVALHRVMSRLHHNSRRIRCHILRRGDILREKKQSSFKEIQFSTFGDTSSCNRQSWGDNHHLKESLRLSESVFYLTDKVPRMRAGTKIYFACTSWGRG